MPDTKENERLPPVSTSEEGILEEDVKINDSNSKTLGKVESWILRRIALLRHPPHSRHIISVGLLLIWLTTFFMIGYGAWIQKTFDQTSSSPGFSTPFPSILKFDKTTLVALIRVSVSIGVTAISDLTGLVHSISLRTALLKEGRLEYNSNLRLFKTTKTSWLHSWPINVAWFWSLVSCYVCGSTVMMLLSGYEVSNHNWGKTNIMSGFSLIFLGIGLMFQAFIATWAWLRTDFLTTSTNPLYVAAMYQNHGWLSKSTNRTMLSVYDKRQPCLLKTPTMPIRRQQSLLASDRRVKRVLCIVWLITILLLFLFIAIATVMALRSAWGWSTTWNPFLTHDTIASAGGPAFAFSLLWTYSPFSFVHWLTCVYLPLFGFMCSFTLALHCIEILTQASREEVIWRRSGASSGVRLGRCDAFTVAFTSWQTILLFLSKCLVHWFFPLAFQVEWNFFEVYAPQILYTIISMLVPAILSTSIAYYRPKGPQPTAYGHLQTIVDLVDNWPYKEAKSQGEEAKEKDNDLRELDCNKRMYWGDKGENADYTRRAGIAFDPVPPIHMNRLYY